MSSQVLAKLNGEWVPIPAFHLCLLYVTYTTHHVPSPSLQPFFFFTVDGTVHLRRLSSSSLTVSTGDYLTQQTLYMPFPRKKNRVVYSL